MSRTTWILGNWKQNHRQEAAAACARDVAQGLDAALGDPPLHIGIAPPYLSLASAAAHTRPTSALWLLAQDVAAQESGAFTGEVGAAMLKEVGVEAVLVGHSERRSYYAETNAQVAAKVHNALSHGLRVVLCVGEGLEARESGEHESTVISQLSESLAQVEDEQINATLIIAYEPIWAIGTGRVATPAQANAMHGCIRSFLTQRFGANGRDRSILYGGSVKPGNAAELIRAGDIDGFLVGGASLDPASFLAIAGAARESL